tara:strand:- start:1168 stop:2127 length:960 start_codon:yes stop_codon:yes gene_type:complete
VKPVHVVIGGTYFLESRVRFFDNPAFLNNANYVKTEHVGWEQVYKMQPLQLQADRGFVFGIKHWARKMRKKRLSPKDITHRICKFLDRTFGTKMPIGLLDDLELRSGSSLTGRLMKEVFKRFNCQVVLLREYLKGSSYDKRVYPFAISSISRMDVAVDPSKKEVDLYFRGDNSSDDRKAVIGAAGKIKGIKKQLKVYRGGTKSPEKISEEEFFKQMAAAKMCLNVMGNGYSCYRYQEIPSVGSILVTKHYPLVTDNDYVDMHHCIKFKDGKELKEKVTTVLASQDRMHDMTTACKAHFLQYHTTERRFADFISYLERLT